MNLFLVSFETFDKRYFNKFKDFEFLVTGTGDSSATPHILLIQSWFLKMKQQSRDTAGGNGNNAGSEAVSLLKKSIRSLKRVEYGFPITYISRAQLQIVILMECLRIHATAPDSTLPLPPSAPTSSSKKKNGGLVGDIVSVYETSIGSWMDKLLIWSVSLGSASDSTVYKEFVQPVIVP